jgi:two-component system invasion response regulator UvrY
MEKEIKVHIADDHKIVIEGVIAVLNIEKDIKVIDYSLTGKEVLDWFEMNTADVLILDINMPVVGGIEVLKRMKKKPNPPKIIVLSSYDDLRFIQEIMTLGAHGFLSKSSAGEQIVKAIRTVNNNEQYISEDVRNDLFKLMFGQKVKEGERPPDNKKTDSLSAREIDVLRLIAQEYNSVQISEILNISVHTVKTYRKNLLTKLKITNTVGLTKFALKHKIM